MLAQLIGTWLHCVSVFRMMLFGTYTYAIYGPKTEFVLQLEIAEAYNWMARVCQPGIDN